MLTTSATLRDAQQFVDDVEKAGGRVPDVLANVLSGEALLKAHGTPTDPARAIVDAAVDGTLTESTVAELIGQAAMAQMIASYGGDLRRRAERMFVDAFFSELQHGAADEILDSLRPAFDTAAEAIAPADYATAEVTYARSKITLMLF